LHLKSIKITYSKNDIIERAEFNDLKMVQNEDLGIYYQNSGHLFGLHLVARKPLILKSFCLETKANIRDKKMLVNGYQAWTESMELTKNSRLKKLVVPVMTAYGDYFFYKYSGEPGDLHSYTFTYFYKRSSNTLFMGSIDESAGYTIFHSKLRENRLFIHKECEGLAVDGGSDLELVKIFMAEGTEKELWEEYLSFFDHGRKKLPKCSGWTSWYNYYTHITEDIIVNNLNSLSEERIPIDIFQIDDGYQAAVGDWLHINHKFPQGMADIAARIKKAGYRAGIWLAPFICERKSKIYREHRDWFLRDRYHRPVVAGINMAWSGEFYALDFYNQDVRDYLTEVFRVVLDEWGYAMVKLDFLYAVSIVPRHGKTRACIMMEAMTFLNKTIGERWILGCGVPLEPTFHNVDYCRIGADVAPYWENRELKYLRYRERISTIGALHNTIARSRLNGKVFLNDPDVFILRKENNHLRREQKYTLFFLNNLLGGLIFTSDDIKTYDPPLMRTYKSMFPMVSPDIQSIRNDKDVYEIGFQIENRHYIVFSNINQCDCRVFLPKGFYFNSSDLIVEGGAGIWLKPYETKCYCKVNVKTDIVLGTTGHLFSGSEIKEITYNHQRLEIELKDGFINETMIYIREGVNPKGIKVVGGQLPVSNYQLLVISNW
jgi:alpha-galactosidase